MCCLGFGTRFWMRPTHCLARFSYVKGSAPVRAFRGASPRKIKIEQGHPMLFLYRSKFGGEFVGLPSNSATEILSKQ